MGGGARVAVRSADAGADCERPGGEGGGVCGGAARDGADARALARGRGGSGCGADADLSGAASEDGGDGRAGGSRGGAEDAAQYAAVQCAGMAVGDGSVRRDGGSAGERRVGEGLDGAVGGTGTGRGDAG